MNKLKSIIKSTIRQYLNEQQENNRYLLFSYDETGNQDNDEKFELYNIDPDNATRDAYKIAKDGGIRITSNNNLSGILIDTKLSRVIGAIWFSNNNYTFSFDIALDSSYQNMGLSSILINAAISEYNYLKEIFEDIEMEVLVINPKLVQILKNKYGFYVVRYESQDRVIMSIDNNNDDDDDIYS